MSFLQGDRRRIQVALNLPISQLMDGSELASRMSYVEDFDAANGTAIVEDILGYLSELDALEDVLQAAYLDGSAAAAVSSTRVDEYSETFGFGSASGRTLGSGYQERKNFYIQAIQRDLGYGSGALGGRIPVM